MRLDCHQHFWSLRNSYTSWPTADLKKIHRDFGPGDLAPHLLACGIDATVLVQAAPSMEETQHLLKLASQTPYVKGVVGWVDFTDRAASAKITQLAANPLLKGLRPMLQDIGEAGWILQDKFHSAFQAMIDLDLRFDALVKSWQIDDIIGLSKRYPELPIVLDHAGKPEIADDGFEPWARRIERLATCPAVHCKISGLWTEAGGGHQQPRLQPYVDRLIECFGPSRLMWGSDWPVVELVGSYEDWFSQSEQLLSSLAPADREAIFGANGLKFYGIANG